MRTTLRTTFAILALFGLCIVPAHALEVTVTVENLAPNNGGVLTPVWVGFSDGSFDLYDIGVAASPGLERIAEDGNFGPLSAEFLASGAGTIDGAVFGPGAPDAPIFFPGQVGSATFDLDPNDPSSRYFSYASMIIPSNDAFIANGNPVAHPIFDGLGNFLGGEFYIYGTMARDAGTEVNDEVPANTAFFGQAAPDTGVVEGGTVQVHPGLLPAGSGGILDAADFANADFTAPGYRIAKVTITAAAPTTIRFYLSGDQEVPPVTTDTTGVCTGYLSPDQSTFDLECVHDVTDANAAHIHQAPAGENGGVIFDLGDGSSPIRASWSPTADEVEALLAGDLYVNVHSPTYPAGQIRGQIDGCFDGPVGLCLQDNRFQVTATWDDGTANGDAVAKGLTNDSGTFYFFGADNVELLVKVIDGCDFNGYYWVFASGLTNLGVEFRVEDTATGNVMGYSSPLGTDFAPILDTMAFLTCP